MTNISVPPSRSSEEVVRKSLIVIVLAVFAIAGNVLVLVAVYRNLRLRRVSNVYIVCLSLTDLLMAVFVFPFVVGAINTGNIPGGHDWCWFQGIVSPFLLMTSLLTMAMIAVQRYYKIVKPNKHRNIFSRRFVVLSIVLIWSIALVVNVVLALTSHGVHFYENFPICLVDANKIVLFAGFYLICLLFPFFTMSLLYFKIWRFIKSHNAQMNHSNVNAEEVKLTKSLCIVLGAFVVCFTPFSVVSALTVVYNVQLPRQIHFFSLCTITLTSVVNPIIYGVMNREFRAEFVKIICYPWKSRLAARGEPTA